MAPRKAAAAETADEGAQKVPGQPSQAPAVAQPKALMDFGWAVNVIKLNRSIAFVQHGGKRAGSEGFEDAVKARYLELGGLLAGDAPSRGGKKKAAKGGVVNMAEDNVGDDED